MADTDKDGLSDALERRLGTDPKDKDSDNDGLTDGAERTLGTRPLDFDSDGDGLSDGSEVAQRFNPKVADPAHAYGARERPYTATADDPDGDRLGSMMEGALGTDPNDPDSDGDGLGDWVESIRGTDPLSRFSDGSGDKTTDLEDVQRELAKATKPGQRLGAADAGAPVLTDTALADPADPDGEPAAPTGAGSTGGGASTYRDPSAIAAENARTAFLDAARAQIGDKYKFGAEADLNDADPTAFDSSELVQWAAARAGVEIPDGSWKQYQFLHEKGAGVSVEDALKTPGALVFGFSSDPLASNDRPARAYVGISLGDGRVLDVSERSGEVREMDPGNFYTHGALIPGMVEDIDTDHDGMIDVDERVMERDPYDPTDDPSSSNPDSDGDGMLDVDEELMDRDPNDPSDGGTSPYESDESEPEKSQEPSPDSDGDGMLDVDEELMDRDPNDPSDGGTSPYESDEYEPEKSQEPSPDSDGDGMLDVDEELMDRDPNDPSDGGTSPYENDPLEPALDPIEGAVPEPSYDSGYDTAYDPDADAAVSMSSYDYDDMDT